MAKPKRYPRQRVISLSDPCDEKLVKRAKEMGVAPAVAARAILERELLKEAANG